MPEGFPLVFRDKNQIVQQYLEEFQASIPDVYVGEDGNLRIFIDTNAGVIEALFFGLQILYEDMFIASANIDSLRRYGVEYGVEQKAGTRSTGELLFSGAGGTFIDVGAEIAFDPDTGEDILYYATIEAGTIPNPGVPTAPTATEFAKPAAAPTVAINVAAGNLNGTYEYGISFVKGANETAIGPISAQVSPVNQQVNLSVIPLGPAGTTGRKIYRRKSTYGAGVYRLVATISDNATVLYTDNITDAVVDIAAQPPVANLTGTYEWAVTFVTIEGETEIGLESLALALTASQVEVTGIPLGGPGTTARRLYRSKNGEPYLRVVAADTPLTNNVTTTYTDNQLDAAVTGSPPIDSTAERIRLDAQSDDFGAVFNAVPGVITQLVDVPDGVTSVTNTTPFIGGSDEESLDEFRDRLLEEVRTPKTGSALDIKSWAESFDDVESAAVFENDNLGVATNGHTTIRISGPDGTIPTAATQTLVYDFLKAKNIANITLHVTTFTPVLTDVTVTLTLDAGYVLLDVEVQSEQAIKDYINALAAGETLYKAGVVAAVFDLPGISNVVVNVPATDLTTLAAQKRVPNNIIAQL